MISEGSSEYSELRMLRSAIETSVTPMMFVAYDVTARKSGAITYVNRALLELYKFDSREEIIGKTLRDFWDIPDESAATFTENGTYEGTRQRLTQKGDPLTVHIQVSSVLNEADELTGMMISFADVTEVVSLREELIKKEKLAAIGRISSIVGHELRNPLGVIKNSAYFLKLVLGKTLNEKVDTHLSLIEEEVNRCSRIISDLLDFARGPKKPEKRVIHVNELLGDVLHRIRVPEDIDVQMFLHDVPVVHADKDHLIRVFINIINNAIESMPKGGNLMVSTLFVDGNVSISIKDNGGGIDEKDKVKMFTPLFSTKVKGTGLGLYVVKQLIESNGGDISFTSQVNEGTEFTVSFPPGGGSDV